MNTMEFCLDGNWVCAQDVTWRFPGIFLIWILIGQYSGFFGWKFPDGTRLGNLDYLVVGKWNRKELRSRDWGVLINFKSYLGSVTWKDVWLENPDGPQLSYMLRLFVGNLELTPAW